MEIRGSERERCLSRPAYFSDEYFRLDQLCSFAHQIHDIHGLAPKDIIEIGIGNGFTSSYLKRAGHEVVTVDINQALEPDICAPLGELEPLLAGRRFDLVVCCEVLEHMPFEQFEANIRVLRSVGSRLYLTLPTYRMRYGFGGFLRLPMLRRVLNVYVPSPLPGKHLEKEHFWELGSSAATRQARIVSILRNHYRNIRTVTFALNPNHVSFVAEG